MVILRDIPEELSGQSWVISYVFVFFIQPNKFGDLTQNYELILLWRNNIRSR